VYENRVLHGFVSILTHAAKSISKRLGQPPIESRPHVTVDRYLSFFSQIKKFSSTINKSKIERCERLVKNFDGFAEILRRRIPIKSSFKGVPQFTQKAKQNIHYQKVFHRMIAWHRFGAPDWSMQEELFSIKNIPKLFEYYLLFLVKDHFDKLPSIQGMTISRAVDAANGDKFEYVWGRLRLRIMYEPKIWQHGHDEAHSQVLINSEGWTAERDGSKRLTGNFHRRSSRGAYSRKSPDIMISLSDSRGNRVYFIIDAKYTNSQKAFSEYIPDLTLKCLNGIHERNTGQNLSFGLMIVNADEAGKTQHYHHHEYSIYGQYPVTPAIMVSSIQVGSAHDEESNIKKDLTRVICLMRSKIEGKQISQKLTPTLEVVA
jgi:hypothetical protein